MELRECFTPTSSRMACAMLEGVGISGGRPVACTLELDTSGVSHLVVKFCLLGPDLERAMAALRAMPARSES